MGVGQAKICSKCDQVKALDDFALDRYGKHGRYSICKTCKAAWRRADYAADPQRTLAINRAALRRVLSDPDRRSQHLARERSTDRAFWAANTEQARAAQRAKRAANPQLYADFFRKNNLRRRSQLVGDYTPAQLAERMVYWHNQCWMCGGAYESVDHVKPLNRGGPDLLANLRPACRSCNSRKSDHWPWPLTTHAA